MVEIAAGDGPGGSDQPLQRPDDGARHQRRQQRRQQKSQQPGEEQRPQEVLIEELGRRWFRLAVEDQRPAEGRVGFAKDQPARAVAVDERAEDAATAGVGHDQALRAFDLR